MLVLLLLLLLLLQSAQHSGSLLLWTAQSAWPW
jgi:hypothetical protein